MTSAESEFEPDNEGIVEPDHDRPQQMGDATLDVTFEMEQAAQSFKAAGVEALEKGDFVGAMHAFTDAVLQNPKSAILYASRAIAFVRMKKPNAAIRDSDAALKLNPESAKAHKVRISTKN